MSFLQTITSYHLSRTKRGSRIITKLHEACYKALGDLLVEEEYQETLLYEDQIDDSIVEQAINDLQ